MLSSRSGRHRRRPDLQELAAIEGIVARPSHRAMLHPGRCSRRPDGTRIAFRFKPNRRLRPLPEAIERVGRRGTAGELACPQVAQDWPRIYGHPLYFLETFIDPDRFRGTCYRAANWIVLGRTTGRGKNAPTKRPTRSLKEVLGYPLLPQFRERLRAD